MIPKIASVQHSFDYQKQNQRYKAKKELSTRKSTAFANILDNIIKSKNSVNK
ncbi:hypothetical protein [Sporomusa acidovorans]|uniref:Uncharacterized protein n=1 Tax=Sporomusa acidovorans (strain ATCC 49682 / DSM 3132 / Mol) TaxID=1123286 RepID=A0ABZ3IY66_SPOA4|nr:hypothetical protein [Sporomusa acidovorans]OZC15855.1 hypothetical protein SPACI_46760 [Sporomusa acidovorans DSM 3132]SDF29283.1 hypothetical protein SAMN04488499_10425 [Sporomusa acidovorans]